MVLSQRHAYVDINQQHQSTEQPVNAPTQTITYITLILGIFIGSILNFTNMYLGLQSGWISMMCLQSSLLAYLISHKILPLVIQNLGYSKIDVEQNVFVQTVSTAISTMPLAGGFVGILPAIEIYTKAQLSTTSLFVWCLGVSLFGIFVSVGLRHQTIIKENLKFPSGTATAQMIELLHKKHDLDIITTDHSMRKQWISLIFCYIVSSITGLLNAKLPTLLQLTLYPLSYNWGWYISPILSYVGQGIIMGLPTTISMFLGAVVGWGILGPLSLKMNWSSDNINDWKYGPRGWILWVSLAIMVGESIVSLLAISVKETKIQFQRLKNTDTQLTEDTSTIENKKDQPIMKTYVTVLGLLFSSIVCLVCVRYSFAQITTIPTILALVLSYILSILAVRALGETDLNPVSGIGKVSQILFAYILPNNIVGNIVAGGISEAGAQQAGDLMQDFKTGHLLNCSPLAQFYGQLIGTVVSVFVSVVAYTMFTAVYQVPSTKFPIPTAYVWLDMATIVNDHKLPPYAALFSMVIGSVFVVVSILKILFGHLKLIKYLPSGIAFAIGIYNPPYFTLPRLIGALMSYFYINDYHLKIVNIFKRNKQEDLSQTTSLRTTQNKKVLVIVVASGFVLGEGTMSIILLFCDALIK